MSDEHARPVGPYRPGPGHSGMRIPFLCFFDRRDEDRARALRSDLGHRGRIVSWHRDEPHRGPRRWVARVSCPDWPHTLEGCGPSRCRAIREANDALDLVVAFGPIRGRGRRPGH